MGRGDGTRIERRVADAAETALGEARQVAPLDVLLGLGWLAPSAVDRWRQGRIAHLEGAAQVSDARLAAAMQLLRRWAEDRGLVPSEVAYVARTRDRRELRFSARGDPELERAYRTHWLSPELSARERDALRERTGRPPDLVVIDPIRDWSCAGCGEGGGLLMMEEAGPVCLSCADMDHLVILAAGDAALTRRARAASALSAVVVRFSRSRRRYERQGVLVEEEALQAAERQCLADEDARAARRARERERRAAQDEDLQARMAREIARLFPGCPPERATAIARHAGARGSGRVGRTAAGRAVDPVAIERAVAASVRHADTPYDDLLMAGVERGEARARVADRVERIMRGWRGDASP